VLFDPAQADAVVNELLVAKRKPEAALDQAIQALTPAAEAQKAMRALQNPSGAPDTTVIKPNHSPTYRPAEKRELDRVIGTQR
jgi:hypothetical protein